MQLKRTAQMVGTVQKRQLGRKMQILHKLATCFLCKITDAPHTGARLETSRGKNENLRLPVDAPHTGARLETRIGNRSIIWENDAPHTGARLETYSQLHAEDW